MVQAGESEAPVRRQGFFPSQFYLISELLPSSFNSPSLFLTLLCHPRKQHSQPVAVLTSQICTHRDPGPSQAHGEHLGSSFTSEFCSESQHCPCDKASTLTVPTLPLTQFLQLCFHPF